MAKSYPEAKGRKPARRFAHLPKDVLEHPAVTTLKHAQFRVLVLLAGQFSGYNNGEIGITATQAGKQGIGSEHTFYRALEELEARKLIRKTYPASRVPARPTMYALTWRPLNDTKYTNQTTVASNDFEQWKPDDEN